MVGKVDVIGDEHQIPYLKLGVEATSGIGHHQASAPAAMVKWGRPIAGDLCPRNSEICRHHRDPAQFAKDQAPGMAVRWNGQAGISPYSALTALPAHRPGPTLEPRIRATFLPKPFPSENLQLHPPVYMYYPPSHLMPKLVPDIGYDPQHVRHGSGHIGKRSPWCPGLPPAGFWP